MTNNLTNNNVTFFCLKLRTLNKHLDRETLIKGLQCLPLVLCLTEIWFLKNKNDKKLAVGDEQMESSEKIERSAGAMIQMQQNCKTIIKT